MRIFKGSEFEWLESHKIGEMRAQFHGRRGMEDHLTNKLAMEVEIDSMSMRQPRLSLICPYHAEDTGSLVLNTRDSTFHCFGCGAEGEIKKINAVLERKQ